MVEARGLHKSLPSVKIVYCTMEVKPNDAKIKNYIQCTIWGQLIKDTKFVIASHAHTITIPY